MRIGIDARLTSYSQAGISQYVRHLVSALAEVDQSNLYTVYLGRRKDEAFVRGANFRTRALLTPPHHRLERWGLSPGAH